jgi:hypothetical protein
MLAFLTRGFHKLSDPASVQVETLERSNKPAATSRKPVIADTPGCFVIWHGRPHQSETINGIP